MNPDNQKSDPGFNASLSLPLPSSYQKARLDPKKDANPAADLVRKKVEAAYVAEPPDAVQQKPSM
jgi:hypothetical protein